MQLRDSPEEAAFREEVRAWIAANLPDDLRGRRGGAARFEEWGREWSRKLGDAGYAGADLAEGVRRRRRAVLAPGDPARGARRGAGAGAHRRDRPRDGGADDHRPRHRRAEDALPAEDPLGRGDLVPGLLRAGRRLRPRRRAHARRAPRRPLRRQRPEGLVVVRAPRRLVHPRHAQRPGRPALPGAHVPDRRHARARRRGAAAAADHRRGRVQRDLLHRRRGAGRERARRDRAGLAGGDDDAAARAGGARLRAGRGVRGRGRQAARAGAGARARRPAPRPDRAELDRAAGAEVDEQPRADAARRDRRARARGLDPEAALVGGEPAPDEARARAARPRVAGRGRRRLLACPAAAQPRQHDRGRHLGDPPQHHRRARARASPKGR